MENTSDDDENVHVGQEKNKARKFINGKESFPESNWKDISHPSTFRSFQEQKYRVPRKKNPYQNTNFSKKQMVYNRVSNRYRNYKSRIYSSVEYSNSNVNCGKTQKFYNSSDFKHDTHQETRFSKQNPDHNVESDCENGSECNIPHDGSNLYAERKEDFPKIGQLQRFEFLPNVVNRSQQCFKTNNTTKVSPHENITLEVDEDSSDLNEVFTYMRKREECSRLSQTLTPSEIILGFRKRIENLTNNCVADNLHSIQKIRSMILQNNDLAITFKKHENNLLLQQNEFEKFVSDAKNEISSIQFDSQDDLYHQAENVVLKAKNECSLFRGNFPAYAYKHQIINALEENQVIIVSSDYSYFFNLVIPSAVYMSFHDHFIVCYESNELAQEYAKHNLSKIINESVKNSSKLIHVNDDELIRILSPDLDGKKNSDNFSLRKKHLESKTFIAVLNLPLKRSVNLDLSLSFLRKLLLTKKDSSLILLTSIFDCSERYEKYFSEIKVHVLNTPKLLLPAQTVWKEEHSDNYIHDVVSTALSIHVLNNKGNILVFLPNEDEANTCTAMLTKKLNSLGYNDAKCIMLHEKKDLLDLNSVDISGKRIICFSTEAAEIMPLSSVRYVIDSGLKKEYIYDTQKKISILKTQFCSRSKSRLRKSLCCVFGSGVCYRIYSKNIFCLNMASFENPDFLTCNPFDSLIKMFQYAPGNALSIECIEPLNNTIKRNTLKKLYDFRIIKDEKLTQLGAKIAKLPLAVEYSKLIHQCIGWGYAYEAIIIVAYFMTDLFVFEYAKDEETQRVIDASKLELLQHDSDVMSVLNIFKMWTEHNHSRSWCEKFHINYNTLIEIQKNMLNICQFLGEHVQQEFNTSSELHADIIQALLQCFTDNFCVFSGHYRSGYRILSSSQSAFIHPSSMLSNNKENPPHFLIFNKIICSSRTFMIGITALDPELVHEAVTRSYDRFLNYDISDLYEKQLVKETIEPVGEKIIKQVLLGKKGHKLIELENSIQCTLKTESIKIDPIVEKGCVNVYAFESCLDEAVEMVKQILKENVNEVINAEKDYILELKKQDVIVPLKVRCVRGVKIISVTPQNYLHPDSSASDRSSTNKFSEKKQSSVQFSVNLTWVRRPCNGKCYITFSEDEFNVARKLTTKYISILGCDVYVEIGTTKNNQLLFIDVPPEARVSDIEDALKRRLPNLKSAEIYMLFTKPFESTHYEVKKVKEEIKDICKKFTHLSLYEVIVPKPKDSATIWTAYINVFCTEDLTDVSQQLSNVLIDYYKMDARPVYRSIINTNFKIYKALEERFKKEIVELKNNLTIKFPNRDLFTFEAVVHEDLVRLKLHSNDSQIMKHLQSTVNRLLEGEILDKNAVKEINKLFCHGGHLWLRRLERFPDIYILEEYNSKIIRIYGSPKNCFKVKRSIVSFLEDYENDAVDTVVLNRDNKDRTLLKAIIKKYGINLELFIELHDLCSAILDIKANKIFLHGNRDNIDKAKDALDELSCHLNRKKDFSLADDGEKCPVCTRTALNLTFRLQYCNHLYCRECILGLVEQTKFPKHCCAENCSEDIVLDDIERILDEDKEKINKLLHGALSNYVERNQTKLIDCPAPDCSMFFNREGIPNRLTCPLCQNDICTRCNVVYHYGYTCDMFKNSRTDPDYSLKVFQQNKGNDCKDCPKCKTPIQRTHGCDHMTCRVCQAHFCWVCCREFSNARDVYNHIPFCDMHPKW